MWHQAQVGAHRSQIEGQRWVGERHPARMVKVENRIRWLEKRVAFHEAAVALLQAALIKLA